MNNILCRQLAIDYCCLPEDVLDDQNHFTAHRFLEGRRRFHEKSECFLKIAAVNGKLLFCGSEEILSWCEEQYMDTGSAWFCEVKNLYQLNKQLHEAGYRIGMAHPFYIAETMSDADTKDYEIRWYHGEEIEQFRGDERYEEAYSFSLEAPDVIGVAALWEGQIVGMAGASADSETMWQIGIDVDKRARGNGIGKMLTTLLKNEILKRGVLPYYGTGMSHIASQKVAIGSGFLPAWAELVTEKIFVR